MMQYPILLLLSRSLLVRLNRKRFVVPEKGSASIWFIPFLNLGLLNYVSLWWIRSLRQLGLWVVGCFLGTITEKTKINFDSGFLNCVYFYALFPFPAIGLVSNGCLLGTITEKTKINFVSGFVEFCVFLYIYCSQQFGGQPNWKKKKSNS